MAKNALPILVAALGLFAKMAAANHEKHESEFRQCLCWNSTTNDFCGGNDWYNSDACNNWLWHAVGPSTIAAVFGFVTLLAFPVLFYLARWCCRCCGGRYATRGCCCADYSSRPTFPGYKNCSIGVTKGLFFGAVAVTIVSSVFLMQNSTKLHTDVNAATSAISETLAAVQPKLDAGNRAALEMATGIMYPAFAPVELALKLDAASKAFPSKHSDVSDTLNTVKKAENHPYWGRNYLAILVPASGLALVFVAVMCALFNQRSFVGLVMVAMCIHTATMAILAVPHHWMSQATEYGCDNFEATLVPLAVGAGQKYGICNNSAITADLKTTATNLQNFATSPDSSFCKDFKTACEAMGTDCQFTPCSDWMSYQKPGTLYFVNYPAVPAEAVKMLNDKINQFSLLAAKLTTVATTNPKAQEAAQRLIDFRTGAIPPLQTLLNATVNLNDNCQFARDQMAGPVYNAICNNAANWRAANVSMGFTNLCVFGAWSIVILILGMKRFRKMNSYNLLRGLDHSDEAAPINGQRPLYSYANDNDDAVIVAKVCRASQGGLESDAVSGIVVTEKEVAYPPQRQSYGGTDGVAYNSV